MWMEFYGINPNDPYQAYLDALFADWLERERKEYHTGGFVGDIQSNEEFAKLMKGEFVSTPAQMSRFMTEILPRIALAGQAGGVNYNAPLVTIQCESVTPEAIPDLERLVNQAVSKIKTEIDNAFSRTGFKKKI